MSSLGPAAADCLERTRSSVLNVLVGVGVAIAVSGLALRGREIPMGAQAPEPVRRGLIGVLLAVAVASYASRRILGNRTALADPARRYARFYRAHVVSAAVGALAIPLGFVYGWVVRHRLEDMGPFWIAALALGFLAYPRAHELEDFDTPAREPSGPPA